MMVSSSKGVELMGCGLDHSGSQPHIEQYYEHIGMDHFGEVVSDKNDCHYIS